jgi:cell division septation protein DedD
VLAPAGVSADCRALTEARCLEAEGRSAAARAVHRAASETAETAAERSAALSSYLRLETDVKAVARALKGFMSRTPPPQLPRSIAEAASGILQLAGFTEDAVIFADAALGARPGPEDVRDSVLLHLEMNDTAGAEAVLSAHDGGVYAAEISARLLMAYGDLAGARAGFTAAGATLTALAGLSEASAGDVQAAQTAAAGLSLAFPRAPETVLARARAGIGGANGSQGARVTAAPQPAQYLQSGESFTAGTARQTSPGSTASAQPSAPASPAGPEAPQGPEGPRAVSPTDPAVPSAPAVQPDSSVSGARRLLGVQAGSFGMRENAEDMIRELRNRGFTPVIRETTASGKVLFKVIVLSRVQPADADAAVARLRALGYEPYVFSEGP